MNDEKTSQKCKYCGGELDYGSPVTSGIIAIGGYTGADVYYRSYKNKSTTFLINCGSCLNSGHIEFFLNPEKLREKLKK
jgi:hypothetical protein